MKTRFLYICLVVAGLAGALLVGGQAAAAPAANPQGITVSPAFQMVSIPAGASQIPVTFKITNNEAKPQTLRFSVTDFSTLNESGGLFFVGSNPTQLQKRYGLAKWFSLPADQITVAAKQMVTLQAKILNLPSLQPGGHYGALMISIGSGDSDSGQIGLQPIASSLLFVSKSSGATYSLNLSGVTFKHSLVRLPTSVTLKFQNQGNDHVVPRGTVTITSGSRVISKGVINENSNIILPQTTRQYNAPLRRLSSPGLPGRYKLNVAFRFDGDSDWRAYQQSFTYLPYYSLAVLALVPVLVIALIALTVRRRLKDISDKNK